ncbi:20713_t:CDS:2 [Funneliformis geosporum]|uniref:17145_t:CDS:1 n=1 Tax=Funneliformis geosporum TaxID=1117311 RepID=A0A9W4SN69_9GLOM|nr:20713_t:CDS:2 [Funneliformis geosporum]CAI2175234.1 17145_t:CDS:2 [Funneliformis geosporum]
MSKSLPIITVNNNHVDTTNTKYKSPSKARHTAKYPGKKKRPERKLTARLLNSGGSSADEYDITPHNDLMNQNQNIPIYLSPAESTSSTPSTLTSTPRYLLLSNNNASMPDLSTHSSTRSNKNHGNINSFGRLKKLQSRKSRNGILFPVVHKFKFPSSKRRSTRTLSSSVKPSTKSVTNASTPMIFRRRRKLNKSLKKKKQKSFNIKSPFFAFYLQSSSNNNKSNLLQSFQSFPYEQMTSIIPKSPSLSSNAFDDRLSIKMNLESVQKFIDLPLLFVFENLTIKNDIYDFLLLKIENFILYYHIIDDNDKDDQTWCIERFGCRSNDEVISDIEGVREYFDGERVVNKNKKDFKSFKDDVFVKFKDVEYKELCSVDEILFEGDIHKITRNESDANLNILEIQAKKEILKLGTYSLDEKRRFLNTIRFFTDTKKYSEMLKYYSREPLPIITVQSSGSEPDEDEEVDSDEEEIDPMDAIELIEELVNSCNQYEGKIFTLRDTIVHKSRELDSSIRKFRELDKLAKEMDESISVTRSRSTKEMEETINMADQTTRGIANKLTYIRTRIRDKNERLKQHQQLVRTFQIVELEKRSSNIPAIYRIVLGVFTLTIISVAVLAVKRWCLVTTP